jgi:MEMO1 family protein
VNDRTFIELAMALDAEGLLKDALNKMNACGPGAVAATVAAAKELGVEKGKLLGHTHSNDVMRLKYNQTSEESVGYAAIVF